MHEYGGGSATVHDGVLYYVDQSDQQWYRGDGDGTVRALTAVPTAGTGATPESPVSDREARPDPDRPVVGPASRYADGRVTPSGAWLLSVEERHGDGRTDHRMVALPLRSTGDPPGEAASLVEDRDFVAAPRPSPDGRWVAWVCWDHPSMPWERSELWLARLEEGSGTVRLSDRRRVAGGGDVSVGQPRWGPDGSLLFVDDRTGWWMPYRLSAEMVGRDETEPQPVADLDAEFHAPDWVLGQSTMAHRRDGSLVCRMHRDGRDQVVRFCPPDQPSASGLPWAMQVIEQPCVAIAGLVVVAEPHDERLYVLGSTPTEAQAVFEIPWSGQGRPRRISAAPEPPLPGGAVAEAIPFTAATAEGAIPGLFYAPAGSPGGSPGPPPLVVFCHGGPTSEAQGGLDPVVQYFTSRGLAVAAVNYRGSSGCGRAFRRRLDGLWGVADVDDCIRFASALVEAGLADGDRMAIRGTSAGGLTALGALIRADVFAGAAAWYGVTDLEALAADTHDFESHYVDSLIGPWPEARATYRSRSPIHLADQVNGSVLLLQGVEDPVVPADQSERFAATLADRGVPCRLVLFEGESHGFRQAATIEASLRAELEFYRSLFYPQPAADPAAAHS